MQTPKFKVEKNKRYYLHRKLREKTNIRLDAHKRTMYITNDGDITDVVTKLRDTYGYSVQMELCS